MVTGKVLLTCGGCGRHAEGGVKQCNYSLLEGVSFVDIRFDFPEDWLDHAVCSRKCANLHKMKRLRAEYRQLERETYPEHRDLVEEPV